MCHCDPQSFPMPWSQAISGEISELGEFLDVSLIWSHMRLIVAAHCSVMYPRLEEMVIKKQTGKRPRQDHAQPVSEAK